MYVYISVKKVLLQHDIETVFIFRISVGIDVFTRRVNIDKKNLNFQVKTLVVIV